MHFPKGCTVPFRGFNTTNGSNHELIQRGVMTVTDDLIAMMNDELQRKLSWALMFYKYNIYLFLPNN